MLGTQFIDRGRSGNVYMHAFRGISRKLGSLDFHHHWLKARAAGQADTLWKCSLNETAALANRFTKLDRIPDTPLDGLVYAYR